MKTPRFLAPPPKTPLARMIDDLARRTIEVAFKHGAEPENVAAALEQIPVSDHASRVVPFLRLGWRDTYRNRVVVDAIPGLILKAKPVLRWPNP